MSESRKYIQQVTDKAVRRILNDAGSTVQEKSDYLISVIGAHMRNEFCEVVDKAFGEIVQYYEETLTNLDPFKDSEEFSEFLTALEVVESLRPSFVKRVQQG